MPASKQTEVTSAGTFTSCLMCCSEAANYLDRKLVLGLFPREYLFSGLFNKLSYRMRRVNVFKLDKRETLAGELMCVIVEGVLLCCCVTGCLAVNWHYCFKMKQFNRAVLNKMSIYMCVKIQGAIIEPNNMKYEYLPFGILFICTVCCGRNKTCNFNFKEYRKHLCFSVTNPAIHLCDPQTSDSSQFLTRAT